MRRTDFLDIFHLFCSKSLDFSIVNEYAKKAFVLKFEGTIKYPSLNDKDRCRNPIFTTKEGVHMKKRAASLALVLSMILRSFAVPIFLGLLGGISGIFAGSKGLSLLWPYALMQAGMNANKRIDTLAGHYGLFFCSCLLWLAAMFVLARFLLEKRDVKA